MCKTPGYSNLIPMPTLPLYSIHRPATPRKSTLTTFWNTCCVLLLLVWSLESLSCSCWKGFIIDQAARFERLSSMGKLAIVDRAFRVRSASYTRAINRIPFLDSNRTWWTDLGIGTQFFAPISPTFSAHGNTCICPN